VQLLHVHLTVVADAKFSAGKEVKLLHPLHALAMSPPFETSITGKEVSPSHTLHGPLKLVPLEKSNAGKDVSLSQSCHVLVKLILSLPESLNVTAGKEVKLASLQPLHALWKLVPRDRFKAGKDSSWVQFCHALVKLTSSLAVSENVTAGKDVSPVQPFHALVKLVPLARFR
jgi:hypothetical protein